METCSKNLRRWKASGAAVQSHLAPHACLDVADGQTSADMIVGTELLIGVPCCLNVIARKICFREEPNLFSPATAGLLTEPSSLLSDCHLKTQKEIGYV
jgi:hypothetical protein